MLQHICFNTWFVPCLQARECEELHISQQQMEVAQVRGSRSMANKSDCADRHVMPLYEMLIKRLVIKRQWFRLVVG
jgi:hypothetical protein